MGGIMMQRRNTKGYKANTSTESNGKKKISYVHDNQLRNIHKHQNYVHQLIIDICTGIFTSFHNHRWRGASQNIITTRYCNTTQNISVMTINYTGRLKQGTKERHNEDHQFM